MKVLLISYYFRPYEGVGAKRTIYWYDKLKELFDVKVLTAIKQEEKNNDILFLRPKKETGIFSKLIKDEGVKWLPSLKQFFMSNSEEYDVIIISGGPFMQMLITKFLSKNTKSKIILDFRDPFYSNPRFDTGYFKDSIKLFFQNRFIRYADYIITVNDYCAKTINRRDITIINNGYDDSVLEETIIRETESNKIISIGRIDGEFYIESFINIINKDNDFNFCYFGSNTELFSRIGKGNISKPINYSKILSEISSSEVCILFTGGHPFESTTKIFDYLAFNKKILIITQGEIKTGSIHEITIKYPNVMWAKNNEEDISTKLNVLLKSSIVPFDTSIYSRKNEFQKLLKLLNR